MELKAGNANKHVQLIESLLGENKITPLPYTVFSFNQSVDAFREMSIGRHVGKLVLSLYGNKVRSIAAVVTGTINYSPNEAVLITGGTRGLGLSLAGNVIAQGAKNLILISRSGHSPENHELNAFLSKLDKDVTVWVRAIDISDYNQTQLLLEDIRSNLCPLHTIIHCAFQLADELFENMTTECFKTAMRAKVSGAWNLHSITQADNIKQFVVLSSVASIVANPGQANYVAANYFLEQLVNFRRLQNKHALAINLDMLNDVGVIARNKDIKDKLERFGWQGITSKDVINGMNVFLQNNVSIKAIANANIAETARSFPFMFKLNRFNELVDELANINENLDKDFRQLILSTILSERLSVTEDYLTQSVAKLLRKKTTKICPKTPLNDQGIDSLLAIELITLIENELGIVFSASNMMNTPSIKTLSPLILKSLTGESVEQKNSDRSISNQIVEQIADRTLTAFPEFSNDMTITAEISQLTNWLDRSALTYKTPSKFENVLLTGANGFFGIYLLRDLLKLNNIHVTCMIRGDSKEHAKAKLKQAWQRYKMDESILDTNAKSYDVLCADLSLEHFGLSDSDYSTLANNIDAILHFGASLNHVHGYSALRPVNVLSTLQLLHLCGTGCPKSLHFASSIAVYDIVSAEHPENIVEFSYGEILEGYGQSKAVCEQLLNEARSQGLIGHIFRIAPTIGDTINAISGQHDFIWLILKTCLTMGVAPDSNWNLYLTPVDHASSLISKIIMGEQTSQTVNVYNKYVVSLNDLIKSANRLGHLISIIPKQKWTEALLKNEKKSELLTYFVFKENTVSQLINTNKSPQYGHQVLDKMLAKYGISTVEMNAEQIDIYVQYLIESDYITPPLASTNND